MSESRESGDGGYLVVAHRYGRPFVQQWPELYFGESGDQRTSVIKIVPLDVNEADLSRDELVRRHSLLNGTESGGGR